MTRLTRRWLSRLHIAALIGIWIAAPALATTDRSEGQGYAGTGTLGVSVANTDLFSGAMSTSVQIVIPPGRMMTTPDLKLAYSSAGGHSPVGFGWALPIGSIERSTKHGVPSCTGDHTNEFNLLLAGVQVELVHVSGQLYRAKSDEAYGEALADTSVNSNSWIFFDRRGMKYTFGDVPSARSHTGLDVFLNEASCHFTTRWALTRMTDPNGNTIDFTYVKRDAADLGETLYLDKVAYGANPSTAVANHPFTVTFAYTVNPYPQVSYRNGVKDTLGYLLDRIVVLKPGESPGGAILREYKLDREPVPENGRSLLVGFLEIQDHLTPDQTFTYSSSDFGFARTLTDYTPPSSIPEGDDHIRRLHITDATVRRSLLDMNGDGYVDLVEGEPSNDAQWTVYLGTEDGFSPAPVAWTGVPTHVGTGRYLQQRSNVTDDTQRYRLETIDITGDGLPDYVDAQARLSGGQNYWEVFRNRGCDETDCGFESQPTKIYTPRDNINGNQYPDDLRRNKTYGSSPATLSETWRDLVDMNGDGLPDLVYGEFGQCIRVYLHQGWNATTQAYSFSQNFEPGFCASGSGPLAQSTTSGVKAFGRVTLMDFNGDGLPDLVSTPIASDAVCLFGIGSHKFPLGVWNEDGSWLETVDIWVPFCATDPPSLYWPRALAPPSAADEYYAEVIEIRLNNGFEFEAPTYIPASSWRFTDGGTYDCGETYPNEAACAPAELTVSKLNKSYTEFIDLNADGLPDRVIAWSPDPISNVGSGDALNQWEVLLNIGSGKLEERDVGLLPRSWPRYDESDALVNSFGELISNTTEGAPRETYTDFVDFNVSAS